MESWKQWLKALTKHSQAHEPPSKEYGISHSQ